MGATRSDEAAQLPLTHLTYHILLAIADRDRHGYAIIREIDERSEGAVVPTTGALYLALQRMEDEGLIEESARKPEPGDDARRRYWRLTAFGKSVARAESERLATLVGVAVQKRLVRAAAAGGTVRGGRRDVD